MPRWVHHVRLHPASGPPSGRFAPTALGYLGGDHRQPAPRRRHPPVPNGSTCLRPLNWTFKHPERIVKAMSGPEWPARVAAGAAIGLAGLCAAGAGIQAWAARRDRRRYPPPGVLVDVGGHRLHLDVQGTNSGPTVVLEAGMGSFSANWYWVQTELKTSMRVVAYDRAGLGWSERGRRPRDAATIADELH